jgi:hypothetical protein
MVATYERHGIRFLYPENWDLQEDTRGADTQCVTLQSPGGGFWMLQIVETQQSLERLVAEALYCVKQEYEDVEAVPAQEELSGTSLAGYDMQFFCLDFVISASVRSFSLGDRSCVLLSQAEDSEFAKISPVFAAITTSLIEAAHSK